MSALIPILIASELINLGNQYSKGKKEERNAKRLAEAEKKEQYKQGLLRSLGGGISSLRYNTPKMESTANNDVWSALSTIAGQTAGAYYGKGQAKE
jgi:hypothetical protein